MKREMKIIELPPIDNNTSIISTEIKIRKPGIIRQTSVMAKPDNVSVIMQATGRKPQMILVPVLICEMDPDSYPEEELRKFYIAPPGAVIESEISFYLEYRGSFLYPQGMIMFLFEEI